MFTENLDIFFAESDFGVAVTIGSGESQTVIQAIFDAASYEASEGKPAISTVAPKITCKSSDVSGLTRATPISINGQNYRMKDIQPNGTGISEVYLFKDS